ncbi:Fur family transcriptional regulator [Ottowia testudinis]|uniref:Ferric uptake regulation protein n=1 Tax=Ottowia testudinis TaxID=2816950 RepID=A0A975CLV4_9BURK|nr:Fur family transcriptional regulator [Ottowia testudinis]QTD47407.1 transcriptional repressor [Ottowia testudinis]
MTVPLRRPSELSPETALRRVGLKATAPRLRVLELIQSSAHRHLSAEEVYRLLLEKTPTTASLATVYRVLTQLEASGLLRRQVFDDTRAVYECNDCEHHDHLVCVQCGKVEEFTEPKLESMQEAIADEYGFALRTHRLTLYGVCAACRKKNSG